MSTTLDMLNFQLSFILFPYCCILCLVLSLSAQVLMTYCYTPVWIFVRPISAEMFKIHICVNRKRNVKRSLMVDMALPSDQWLLNTNLLWNALQCIDVCSECRWFRMWTHRVNQIHQDATACNAMVKLMCLLWCICMEGLISYRSSCQIMMRGTRNLHL